MGGKGGKEEKKQEINRGIQIKIIKGIRKLNEYTEVREDSKGTHSR
jgi:hypothetical protein